MRNALTRFLVIPLMWAACSAAPALAQSPEQSLADVARAAAKKKTPSNATAKVYDNENLPKNSIVNIVGRNEPSVSSGDPAKSPDSNKTISKPAPEQWRISIAEQKRKIADLEYELNRLEADNRLLKAEFEDAMTGKQKPRPMSCPGYDAVCVPWVPNDTERYNRYQDYATQRDAKKAQLDAARQKLEQMNEAVLPSANSVIR